MRFLRKDSPIDFVMQEKDRVSLDDKVKDKITGKIIGVVYDIENVHHSVYVIGCQMYDGTSTGIEIEYD